MENLGFRLKRRWNMTTTEYQNDLKFSNKLAWYRVTDNLLGRVGARKISDYYHEKKEAYIQSYLQEIIQSAISKYKDCTVLGIKQNDAPIWVCWWTGVDTAPRLVQQCVKSILANAGNHPVRLITEKNYAEYVAIPEYIYIKMQRKQMSVAHFADYLRVCLLHQYGGLWLDATIFCAESIPDSYFDFPFFTCKSEYQESRYLSHFQWTTFVLGGWKGNVFYGFLKEALELYWQTAETAIDYLFFDDLIYLARQNIPVIKKMMDELPINTPHRDDLQAAFNAALSAKEFENIIKSDTPIYKLSWRESYSEITADGEESIYGYFLNKN